MPCSSANEAISCPSTVIENRAAVSASSPGGTDAPCEVAVQAPTAATVSSMPTRSAKRSLRDLMSLLARSVERMAASRLGSKPLRRYDDSIPVAATGQRPFGIASSAFLASGVHSVVRSSFGTLAHVRCLLYPATRQQPSNHAEHSQHQIVPIRSDARRLGPAVPALRCEAPARLRPSPRWELYALIP